MEPRPLPYLNTRELAELVGCDPSTLVKRRCNGELPPAFGGPGHLVWSAEELLEWAVNRTGHLSDGECRLALAVTNPKLCR